MVEKWKDVEGFEGLYAVSNKGRAYSYKTDKILKGSLGKRGYITLRIYKNSKGYTKALHRLVALYFVPNPKNKRCVNHKDGNKQNNCISNLEWCTDSENSQHAYDNNLMPKRYGKYNGSAKINESTAKKIKKMLDSGIAGLEISRKLKVSHYIVYDIKRGKTWRYLFND